MKLLALDFDGVICDSSREIFLVTLRTLAQQAPGSRAAKHFEKCRHRTRPEAFDGDAIYRGFEELHPLGNRAEDFAVAIKAVFDGVAINDQADYDRYFSQQDPGWKEAFHHGFYDQRAALRAEDEKKWLGLHGTWPEITSLLRSRAGSVPIAICTAKDAVSVRKLLEHYGIGELVPDEYILDKENGPDKTVHLSELSRRSGIDPEQMTFVDDKVSHLQKVSALGVRCVLAGWGENGEREHALARQEGFAVASLSDVAFRLFGE